MRPIALHNSLLHMSHCLRCSTWGFHKGDSPLGWYQHASISSSCIAADVKLELWFMSSSSSSGTRYSQNFFLAWLAGTWGSLYSYNFYSKTEINLLLNVFLKTENTVELILFNKWQKAPVISLWRNLWSHFRFCWFWKHLGCNFYLFWTSSMSSSSNMFQHGLPTTGLLLLAAQFI